MRGDVAPRTAVERHLVMVNTDRLQARSEFETIAAAIRREAPDIGVFVVDNDQTQSVTRRQAARLPSVIFSPVALKRFKPGRGKVYAGRSHKKMEEIARLVAGGIPVPETVVIEPGLRLDPATWGPFTIVKPNVGRQGSGVQLMRTRDVAWVDPMTLPRKHPRYGVPSLAQKFIDTGPNTNHFRVLTIFGNPIYSTNSRMAARTYTLDPDGTDSVDVPIASNTGERAVLLNFDAEVIAFASTVWRALPEIPVLGVDVIREHATGKLYVLEVNASGLTWHTSSNYGQMLQAKNGYDYTAQFGAIEIIAKALIERTRADAV
jgi:hypothetical protein